MLNANMKAGQKNPQEEIQFPFYILISKARKILLLRSKIPLIQLHTVAKWILLGTYACRA